MKVETMPRPIEQNDFDLSSSQERGGGHSGTVRPPSAALLPDQHRRPPQEHGDPQGETGGADRLRRAGPGGIPAADTSRRDATRHLRQDHRQDVLTGRSKTLCANQTDLPNEPERRCVEVSRGHEGVEDAPGQRLARREGQRLQRTIEFVFTM